MKDKTKLPIVIFNKLNQLVNDKMFKARGVFDLVLVNAAGLNLIAKLICLLIILKCCSNPVVTLMYSI